jgi:hypothetical protein
LIGTWSRIGTVLARRRRDRSARRRDSEPSEDAQGDHGYANGFWVPAVVDASVVLYTIGYFALCGFGASSSAK